MDLAEEKKKEEKENSIFWELQAKAYSIQLQKRCTKRQALHFPRAKIAAP